MKIDDDLQKASEILNSLSDKVTNRIEEFEEKLKKLNLGIEATFLLDDNLVLGYFKSEHGWRVHLSYSDGTYVPLRDAKRAEKLIVLPRLNGLLHVLLGEAIHFSERIKEVLQTSQEPE